ncbi:RagB/SusD family nutrient uptake outer membrane protein [Chitinophaga agrisoli]|uniref:RagB/SusD family nutrient uptake outer membrane protein n=1 Tax=Chitinophaga agrisoli TaxID=2607653 RepID=A0A5B2VKB3_9BACT|nr:RagB/SusD family nutrient uptake outer membrane protein [Chitinophaga agrisoli]KAA2239511.1 RagB/SusD family nutrient uptake outer membrane protein [Chitinophaga agrisoli]
MNRRYIIYLLGLWLLAGSGCRKYVEIEQVGKRTLHLTKDYQGLLNDQLTMENACFYPMVAADDIGALDDNLQTRIPQAAVNVYTWAPDIYVDNDDPDWNIMYKQIYYCNLVIAGVADSDGGTGAEKKNINAQALVHRALAYLNLVNVYAKQYDAATAATDAGVPMPVTPDFTGSLQRASVQAVYDHIKEDLQAAMPDLDDLPAYSITPSRAGAYAVLARACLQQGDYPNAGKYADSALARQHTLLNLADYAADVSKLPLKLQDPEIIFEKKLANSTAYNFPLSESLLQKFDTTHDLRYQLFTADGVVFGYYGFVGRGYYRPRITNEGAFVGPSVPEMMLIKAECAARAGNTGAALDVLNELRRHRFKPEDYTPLQATNPAAALRLTIDERGLELMGRGFRWFDQKRLNKEAAFAATVTRSFKGQTYTLEPNGNRYMFPIANKYITMNPEITQNPR